MSAADLLEQWGAYLPHDRRRSPHTVRAYLGAANRLIAATGAEDWPALAKLDAGALRAYLAARRAMGWATLRQRASYRRSRRCSAMPANRPG